MTEPTIEPMSLTLIEGQHVFHIRLINSGDNWMLQVDDGIEVWREEFRFASVAMMRVAALVRCIEVDSGGFLHDADRFQLNSIVLLSQEVM